MLISEGICKERRDQVKRIGHKEKRMVNQQLHINEITAYAKQFEKLVIAMEMLDEIREKINISAQKRLHTWSFRKLQQCIKYKANLEEVPVVYVNPKNTSKTYHRCGHVSQVNGRV